MHTCKTTDVFHLYVVSIAEGVLRAVLDDGDTIVIRGHVVHSGLYFTSKDTAIPFGTFLGAGEYRGESIDCEVHYKGETGVMVPTLLTIRRGTLTQWCTVYAQFKLTDGSALCLIADVDLPWELERGIFVGYQAGFKEKLMVVT